MKVKDPRQKLQETHKHELILLYTMVNNRKDFSVKLRPVDLRNLALLSSLSLGLEKGVTLTSLTPYCIPYADMAVHICHNRVKSSEILHAINASLVALCVSDLQMKKKKKDEPFVFDEMPVCECLGLGIVRGLDCERGVLYLVTSLPLYKLRQVNTLLKGSLPIPDQLIFKPRATSVLPYVDALAPSTAVTALRQRARMPRNTMRSKQTM